MGDPRVTRKSNRRLTYGLVTVLLLAVVGGGIAWWTRGSEEARRKPIATPKIPTKLCETPISTSPISLLYGEPKEHVRMRQGSDGGLDDRLDPYAIHDDEQPLSCSMLIDGGGLIVNASLEKSHLSQAEVDTRVQKQGASSISWGKARGYVYSMESSELGVIYFPCTIRSGASAELHRAVRTSMTTSVLHQDKLAERKAVMSLVADVTRYMAKHSAKCLNAGELSGSAPVLK